ncbi:MAG TPA: hypothetical protein VFD67_12530 [Gemmatimonadaceae bacterium]|nr:hypothetical protein [Gemmatimonadaceae bacterium]
MTTIIDRIERELGLAGLAALLAERLEPSDLQSLLLDVYRRLVRRRSTAALLADHTRNRFVQPSRVPPARYVEWERLALSELPSGFEAIELSPVCSLGVSAAMGGLEQDRVVTTIRNTEVLSDSTNVLALETAVRRRALKLSNPRSATPVHLAANHRLLRAQHYTDPRLAAHFRVFSLCSGGRDTGGLQFEMEALGMHIGFYLAAIRAFVGPSAGLDVSLTPLDSTEQLTAALDRLVGQLRERFGVDATIDTTRTVGRGYYRTACFWIHAANGEAKKSQLCDGGCVDWTQRLLSDNKERLVISGLGTDRVCTLGHSMT